METLSDTVADFEVIIDRFCHGSQRRILLVHGLGGNRITWRETGERLARELRATVWAVDLPGFGSTRTGGKRVSLGLHLRVLEKLLLHLGAGERPFLVAGNSLGGILALRLSLSRKVRVNRVVLASLALPLTWGRTRDSLEGIARLVPSALPIWGADFVYDYVTHTGLPGVVDDPIRMLFGDPTRLDRRTREQLLELSGDRLGWAREGAVALQQTTLDLGTYLLRPAGAGRLIRRVKCPVDCLFGDSDPLFPAACWDRLRRERPDWTYRPLVGVGHLPQLEAPKAFVQAMVDIV